MNTDKIYAEAIANEYSVKTTSKVVALRKLDRKVKTFPKTLTWVLGVVSTLILGTGMCFVLDALGGGDMTSHIIGIALSVVGLIGVGVNYPIYKKVLENRKSQYAGDIIRLAGEISKEA